MKAYADEKDLGQEKVAMGGDIREFIVQGSVVVQTKMWRKSVEESENIIVYGKDIRIMAVLSNLLEVVDYATDDPSELVP
jgi:hypothetical protein